MATAFGPSYRFRPPGASGRVAVWAVAVHAVALAAGGVTAIVVASSDGTWRLDTGTLTAGGAWGIGPLVAPMRMVFGVQAVTGLVAMVAWLVWQSRATENAWAARAAIDVSPGWAVLWWFVPFANLWKPAGSIARLLRASAAMTGVRSRDGALVAIWWVAFLGGQVLVVVGFLAMIGRALSPDGDGFSTIRASDIEGALWITATGMLAQAISAVPAIAIVRIVERRQAILATEPEAAVLAPPARPDLG